MPTERKTTRKRRVSAMDFCLAWSRASSAGEAATALGMTERAAAARADRYMRAGVCLLPK